MSTKVGSRGMVLGKFLPPHLGHQYLIDFARHYVGPGGELVVLCCTLSREPIPGGLRYGWMREMFPYANVRVVHVDDDTLPQTPEEHADFWEIWRAVVRAHAGPVDYVFASEGYGARLAAECGAAFVPVDPAREVVPVSGTAVRADPMACWRYLPEAVRPYFLRRVCLFGPESTGKTTMARALAKHFNTAWVHEHARPLLDARAGVCDPADIPAIARGQLAAEDAMARQASRLLFCDTDTLLTTVWSEVLFGACPESVRDVARARHYDLTLLLDIDTPWVDDGQRYLPHRREEFMARCVAALEAAGRRYVVVSGGYEARFAAAVAAVEGVLAEAGGGARCCDSAE